MLIGPQRDIATAIPLYNNTLQNSVLTAAGESLSSLD